MVPQNTAKSRITRRISSVLADRATFLAGNALLCPWQWGNSRGHAKFHQRSSEASYDENNHSSYPAARGVARGVAGVRIAPGVKGAPMMPTNCTKLLFYRIILVWLPKKLLLIDVLAPPHWQKNRWDLPKIWKCWVQVPQLKIYFVFK